MTQVGVLWHFVQGEFFPHIMVPEDVQEGIKSGIVDRPLAVKRNELDAGVDVDVDAIFDSVKGW
jgi:hypothetical protein